MAEWELFALFGKDAWKHEMLGYEQSQAQHC